MINCFKLTPEEVKDIEKWKNEHTKEFHDNNEKYAGRFGGQFTYAFTPTSLGMIGKVKCACGMRHTFRELF